MKKQVRRVRRSLSVLVKRSRAVYESVRNASKCLLKGNLIKGFILNAPHNDQTAGPDLSTQNDALGTGSCASDNAPTPLSSSPSSAATAVQSSTNPAAASAPCSEPSSSFMSPTLSSIYVNDTITIKKHSSESSRSTSPSSTCPLLESHVSGTATAKNNNENAGLDISPSPLETTITPHDKSSTTLASPLPLKNLGNTCYENSIVQCLFSLSTFMKLFKHAFESVLSGDEQINKSDARYKIAYAFTQLYDTWKRIQLKANASANICDNVVDDKDDKCNIGISLPNNANNPNNSAATTPVHDPLKAAHQNGSGNSARNVLNSESPVPLTADSQIDEKLNDLKLAVGERSTQFNSTHQQDASEFFYHVIDAIQEFFEDIEHVSDEENPVTSTFEFELDYFVTCVKCGHLAPSDTEKIRTLPLAMPKDTSSQLCNGNSPALSAENQPSPPPSGAKENKQISDPSEISLQSALVNYFRDDHMEYKCSQDGCDSKEKTRKCMIKKLPRVLFMTLARYSHTGQKNLEEIKAPFEIYVPAQNDKCCFSSDPNDISVEDDNKYQLVAVVCHLGPSLNAGHYTSFVYNQENSTWYSCDDDAVTKADSKQVEKEARRSGYCFFYVHKSTMIYPPPSNPTKAQTASSMTKYVHSGTATTKALARQLERLTSSSATESSRAFHRRSTSMTSLASSSTSHDTSSPSSVTSSSSSTSSSTLSESSDVSDSDDTSSATSSVYLADLSERTEGDRCMTPGCKLFGDKQTNYWLCAICFELQKQELQIYNEGQKT